MNPSTTTERPVFRGDKAYCSAEQEMHEAFDALKALAPENATDRIVDLCREAAAHHGLTDDEHAFLLTWHLIIWRENRQHEDLSSGWAINIASFALACIPESDPLHWICEHSSELLVSAQAMLDNGKLVR